jgi:peroxiredoxin
MSDPISAELNRITQLEDLQEELKQLRAGRAVVVPSEILKVMDSATEELVRSGIRARAAKVGDHVEDFTLPDAHGRPVRLKTLLEHGPLVLNFYRGVWCPFCNSIMRGLQRVQPAITEMGASVIGISPQLPDKSLLTEEENGLSFPVLSDVGNEIARRFEIVFRLPDDLLEVYRNLDHELSIFNGDRGASELPIPATYVLDPAGVIRFAYLDEDYTKRVDTDDILASLRSL